MMQAPPSHPRPDDARARSPWGAHAVCYGLLGSLLIAVLGQRYLRPLVLEEGVRAAPSAAAPARPGAARQPAVLHVDPNTASWEELARLPRIGETIARRIVAYREAHAATAGDPPATHAAPVFERLEDLMRVRGIGPRTIQQIAPHLKMPPAPATGPV